MINYNIDEKTGIVTASISGCANDAMNTVNKALRANGFTMIDTECLKLPDTFTAKAKCHPEDTFDAEVGKKLAKQRLLDKYHTARVKALGRCDDMAEVCQIAMDKAIQKSLNRFKKD